MNTIHEVCQAHAPLFFHPPCKNVSEYLIKVYMYSEPTTCLESRQENNCFHNDFEWKNFYFPVDALYAKKNTHLMYRIITWILELCEESNTLQTSAPLAGRPPATPTGLLCAVCSGGPKGSYISLAHLWLSLPSPGIRNLGSGPGNRLDS